MENRQIGTIFEEISNLMKILQEDPKWSFKAAAYDRARRSLEGFHERAEDLARDPSRKLTEIPGVGEDRRHVDRRRGAPGDDRRGRPGRAGRRRGRQAARGPTRRCAASARRTSSSLSRRARSVEGAATG